MTGAAETANTNTGVEPRLKTTYRVAVKHLHGLSYLNAEKTRFGCKWAATVFDSLEEAADVPRPDLWLIGRRWYHYYVIEDSNGVTYNLLSLTPNEKGDLPK